MSIATEKIYELNELSCNEKLNMPRMKQLAKEIVDALNMPQVEEKKKPEGYEYAHLTICKNGLQRECRQCLFETLCKLDRSYLDVKG